MFDVEVCEPKRVVLIRFRGELAEADFTALDAMGREMQGGPPYDVVFDMTGVEKSHLATDFVSQRGELPRPSPIASASTWCSRTTSSCWSSSTPPTRRRRVGGRRSSSPRSTRRWRGSA